jgi:hypothetical protein
MSKHNDSKSAVEWKLVSELLRYAIKEKDREVEAWFKAELYRLLAETKVLTDDVTLN